MNYKTDNNIIHIIIGITVSVMLFLGIATPTLKQMSLTMLKYGFVCFLMIVIEFALYSKTLYFVIFNVVVQCSISLCLFLRADILDNIEYMFLHFKPDHLAAYNTQLLSFLIILAELAILISLTVLYRSPVITTIVACIFTILKIFAFHSVASYSTILIFSSLGIVYLLNSSDKDSSFKSGDELYTSCSSIIVAAVISILLIVLTLLVYYVSDNMNNLNSRAVAPPDLPFEKTNTLNIDQKRGSTDNKPDETNKAPSPKPEQTKKNKGSTPTKTPVYSPKQENQKSNTNIPYFVILLVLLAIAFLIIIYYYNRKVLPFKKEYNALMQKARSADKRIAFNALFNLSILLLSYSGIDINCKNKLYSDYISEIKKKLSADTAEKYKSTIDIWRFNHYGDIEITKEGMNNSHRLIALLLMDICSMPGKVNIIKRKIFGIDRTNSIINTSN